MPFDERAGSGGGLSTLRVIAGLTNWQSHALLPRLAGCCAVISTTGAGALQTSALKRLLGLGDGVSRLQCKHRRAHQLLPSRAEPIEASSLIVTREPNYVFHVIISPGGRHDSTMVSFVISG